MKRSSNTLSAFITLALLLVSVRPDFAQKSADAARPGPSPSEPSPSPYAEVKGWPQLPPDMKLATGLTGVIGVLPDNQGNVWILQRTTPAVLKIDQTGKLLKSFHYPAL